MATSEDRYLDVSLADEGRLQTVRTILGYEASVRGLTLGQAFSQLLREAVDVEQYPEEVREQLRQIEEGTRRRAIERSVAAAKVARIA